MTCNSEWGHVIRYSVPRRSVSSASLNGTSIILYRRRVQCAQAEFCAAPGELGLSVASGGLGIFIWGAIANGRSSCSKVVGITWERSRLLYTLVDNSACWN